MMNPMLMGNPAAQGVDMGGQAGGMMTAQPTAQFGRRNDLYMSPQQQMALQQRGVNDAATQQMRQMQQQMGVTAGLANQAANANTQRAMVLEAQKNAAMNVANQLHQLSQNRATNASALANAMNVGAGMF